MAEYQNAWRLEQAGLPFQKGAFVMSLVNTEQNQALLAGSPHRAFCDLSVVYSIVWEKEENLFCEMPITNQMVRKLGMTEQELYEAARTDTRELFPPVNQTMKELMAGCYSEEEPEYSLEFPEMEMYLISNETAQKGAVVILYEEELHDLAERVGSDLYLLPSSIHEFLAVSVSFGSPEDLQAIVSEVNEIQVPEEERLSDQVYQYDREQRMIFLAMAQPERTEEKVGRLTEQMEPDVLDKGKEAVWKQEEKSWKR